MSLPKNAHTSLSKMFACNTFPAGKNLEKFLAHGKHKWLKSQNKLRGYDFMFTSIRNPYTRFISSYTQCRLIYNYTNNIDLFIEDVISKKLPPKAMWHSDIQTKHLILEDINFFIKVEKFEEDVKAMSEILGIPTPGMKNANRRDPNVKMSVKCRKRVEEFYKDDFDKLGYKRVLV